MGGIIGVWQLDGRPVDRGMLDRLSRTLAHRGPDGQGLWIDGPAGLACQLLRATPESIGETQPLVHPSGAVLVFDGRLDNREELLATCAGDVAVGSPDPALVLAAYDAFGEGFAERLTGDFALGLFDPKRQQLLLARDAIGLRTLYYWRAADTFLFASEIKAILAHPQVPARPNDDMLASCVFGGFEEDARWGTCFGGIFTLPPSHMAVVTRERFTARRYWDFEPAPIRLGSFQDYAAAFRHHFERAVRRRLRSASPIAFSVSGGLDSSSVFCVAQRLRRADPRGVPPMLGLSYGSNDGSLTDERTFLRAIEVGHGTTIEGIPAYPTALLNGARAQLWGTEMPFLSLQWESFRRLLQAARERGARVLLTGQSGDQVLFDEAYLVDLFRGFAWGTLWEHLREIPRWLTDAEPGVFTRDFFRNLVKHHAPDGFVRALRPVYARLFQAAENPGWYTATFRRRSRGGSGLHGGGPRFATAHARSLYHHTARSWYHVLCVDWYNKAAATHGLDVAAPFLDRDLLAFMMGIPGEIATWKGVPKALLREAMRGVLPTLIAERRWKGDYTELANAGIAREYPRLAHCFQAGGMAARLGYVQADATQRELARLEGRVQGPTFTVGSSIRRLVALELWLQVFFNEHSDGKEVSDHADQSEG